MNPRTFYESLPEPYRTELLEQTRYNWTVNRMEHQVVPPGSTVHGIIAGRGAGKTRAGAEWVRERARVPNTQGVIVVPSGNTALFVAQAIQDCCPSTDQPIYWPTTGQLAWSNGSQTFITTSDRVPTRLRGSNCHYGWAEEPSSWYNNQNFEAWDTLLHAVRLGINPQVLVTGTPSQDAVSNWLQQAIKDNDPDVTVRFASTYDNKWVDETYLRRVVNSYKGTLLEKQNIWGEFTS